ncbi:MAG: ABC transporter permease [Parvibaculaceae bacterium]
MTGFSLSRLKAVLLKELVQMRRDRMTLAMIFGIPILQLLLFGFAINTDPKQLPTAVKVEEQSRFSRAVIAAMENSGYFRIDAVITGDRDGAAMLEDGSASFVVTIPAGFSSALQRGDRPSLLIEADASDPAAASNALAAFPDIAAQGISEEMQGLPTALRNGGPPFETRVHRKYNPEGITQYNIVPGLVGTILTLTTILSTALSLTRERERGTMENLLAMPARPAEIMAGKILPYIGLGLIQVAVIMGAARFVFEVPMLGSLSLLFLGMLLFIATNVSLGYLFSTLARNQMQAMQMTFFFFLPSILLSGFMFPFRGMPGWAQALGEALPLTHFLRIVRGVLLKGSGLDPVLMPMLAVTGFLAATVVLTLLRFRRTLD